MRATFLLLGLLASPAAAQVTPANLQAPGGFYSYTPNSSPTYLRRSRPATITVRNPAFRREAVALQREMAQARGDQRRLSPSDRAVFEQRYAALLQRYGYPVPRFR